MDGSGTHIVYLGLGTNLGDRQSNLYGAIAMIENRIGTVVSQSDFIVTDPVGFISGNMFLNAASEVERRELYEGRWKRLEELIDAADGADTDDAIVSWLAHKFRETNVHGQIEAYAALRDYAMQENVSSAELLDELLRFAERWSEDRGFREKADKAAREWLQNRPRATVSELRMFGD